LPLSRKDRGGRCSALGEDASPSESANFVSLRFCVLDNNIRDIDCVLSYAGLSSQVLSGRIIRPGVAGYSAPLEGGRKRLRTYRGVTQIGGPDIPAREGRIIHPSREDPNFG
jgi:hypothetical protein